MELYSKSDEWRFIELGKKENLPKESYRSYLRRDYARILHSGAFRRLQGKTQLFPGDESDFFRNRLTHSLEVAQIGYDLAVKLNNTDKNLKKNKLKVNPEICEIAGLIHDLGHPPFGHNGERALDDCMKDYGGFEGNAQTLRILLKLEKKERYFKKSESMNEPYIFDVEKDERVGLNLSSRVLASCLKYDNEIKFKRKESDFLQKGYYKSESEQISKIKSNVLDGRKVRENFKTIECAIMDIADDIAYSTYDLEDSLKAGFLTPYDFLSASDDIIDYIVGKCNKKYSSEQIRNEIAEVFGGILVPFIEKQKKIDKRSKNYISESLKNFIDPYDASINLSSDGYFRNEFTSYLVNMLMNGAEVEINEEYPQLSLVKLNEKKRMQVDILKHFTFRSIINSSKLKVAEFRGYDIVKSIFKALVNSKKDGYKLLPEDYQMLFNMIDEREQNRVIADFIAGMTDRYALEFYSRLFSENPQTIFKPL